MPTTDIPSNTISPELTGNTPVIKLNNVVLPAPFGPITPNTSPCFTPKDIPVRAATPPKLLLRHLILIAFSSLLSLFFFLFTFIRLQNVLLILVIQEYMESFLKPNLRLILSTIDSVRIPSGRTAIKITSNAP